MVLTKMSFFLFPRREEKVQGEERREDVSTDGIGCYATDGWMDERNRQFISFDE